MIFFTSLTANKFILEEKINIPDILVNYYKTTVYKCQIMFYL